MAKAAGQQCIPAEAYWKKSLKSYQHRWSEHAGRARPWQESAGLRIETHCRNHLRPPSRRFPAPSAGTHVCARGGMAPPSGYWCDGVTTARRIGLPAEGRRPPPASMCRLTGISPRFSQIFGLICSSDLPTRCDRLFALECQNRGRAHLMSLR